MNSVCAMLPCTGKPNGSGHVVVQNGQVSNCATRAPRLFSNDVAEATMSPTSVVPPRTGGTARDDPATVVPLPVSVALTINAVDNVGTPAIEKVPSLAVTLLWPSAVTVTPAIGCPWPSTTRPTTVVNGS